MESPESVLRRLLSGDVIAVDEWRHLSGAQQAGAARDLPSKTLDRQALVRTLDAVRLGEVDLNAVSQWAYMMLFSDVANSPRHEDQFEVARDFGAREEAALDALHWLEQLTDIDAPDDPTVEALRLVQALT